VSRLRARIDMHSRQAGLLFAAAFLALAAGCGHGDRPELASVYGVVTLDGTPLAGAKVVYLPKAAARSSYGITDANGKYALTYLRKVKGAALGKHRVEIYTTSEESPQERVPEQYNASSTLEAEVKAGSNECNFSLTSK